MPDVTLLANDFDDNALWTNTGNFPDGLSFDPDVVLTLSATQEQVALPVSTAGANYGGRLTVGAYNLTDGALTVRLSQSANPATAATWATLHDGSKYSAFSVQGGLLFSIKTQGGYEDNGGVTYSATNHKWLRVSQEDATDEVVWWVSADGISWNEFWRKSSTGLSITGLRGECTAGCGNTGAPGTAIFDNLTLTAPNRSPTANAGPDTTSTINVPKAIIGSGTDPDGTIASYLWAKQAGTGTLTFGDASMASTTVTSDTTGTFTVRLTVTDDLGATATDDMTLTVIAAATAAATVPATAITGEPIIIDATASSADYVRIEFEVAAGGASNFPTIDYLSPNAASARKIAPWAYLTAGVYTWRVTPYNAADDAGAPLTGTITVSEPNTGGTVRTPAAATHAAISTAIAACSPGDVVELTAGVNYDGTGIVLPAGTGATVDNPITIRSSAFGSGGYPDGLTRMQDTDTSLTAAIRVSGAATNAISCGNGVRGFRFEGIRFEPTGTNQITILVFLFPVSGVESDADEPLEIILNHCVLYQVPEGNVTNALFVSGRKIGFHNGSITNISDPNQVEPKAVLLKGGNGPFAIHNNLLQASGASIFTGTDDPAILPHDLSLVHNWLYKPLTWRQTLADGSENPTWDGITRGIKSTLEYKNMVGSNITGNVFQNVWQANQTGIHILLKATNQGGGGTSNTVSDVDLHHNLIMSANGAIQITENKGPSSEPTLLTKRIRTRHNVGVDINSSYAITSLSVGGNNGQFMTTSIMGNDCSVDHNTAPLSNVKFARIGDVGNQGEWENLSITNNIFNRGGLPTIGLESAPTEGTFSFDAQYTTTWLFDGNLGFVALGESAWDTSKYQRTSDDSSLGLNQFLGSTAAVGFTDFDNQNFLLQSDSSGHDTATDGTDIGADIPMLSTAIGASSNSYASATFNAVTGEWSSQPPPTSITVTVTGGVVFSGGVVIG